ncbi:MAG: RNA polymerase sigma-70 factor [Bacteroidota bacterium]
MKPYFTPSDEQNLMVRITESDSVAFEQVFRKLYFPLKAFAFRELRSDALAEDAVQEVFCTLWVKRHKLQPHRSLSGFLFTCLKNHVLNAVRTKQREILKNQHHYQQQPTVSNPTEHQVISDEIQQDIRHLIDELPEVKRKILTLSLYQGLNNEQIAQQLHLSVHTVKIYLSESSRQIRQLISPSEPGLLLVLLLFHLS